MEYKKKESKRKMKERKKARLDQPIWLQLTTDHNITNDDDDNNNAALI